MVLMDFSHRQHMHCSKKIALVAFVFQAYHLAIWRTACVFVVDVR